MCRTEGSLGAMQNGAMTRFLILPGWHDSGPTHWQSRWAQLYAANAHFQRVEQDDWQWPKRGDWMMRLDETLLTHAASQANAAEPQPTVLVAHSLGCHLVAAWAAHSRHTGLVNSAWLVAPPDLDGEQALAGQAPQLQTWRKVARQRLPFPAVVLASRTDPYADITRSQALADDWGAAFEDLGDAGHVNAESGHGDWPQGWARLVRHAAN
jgi:predicted alpha/beta hydrolase family esterase